MEYRTFGNLGWQVSAIGFGAWAIGGEGWGPQDDADSVRALEAALDGGVNFIDTAQGYGQGHSETLIGKVVGGRPDIYVATKVPPLDARWPIQPDADPRVLYPAHHIIGECEKSLVRLQREQVDVYQFHTWAAAFNIHDEWAEAMMHLREQGKVRAVGVSVPDTSPEWVIGSLARGRVQAVQAIYNVFEQFPQWNLFPACEALGTGVIVRVPFDEGALTGKYRTDTVFAEGDVRRHYFRGGNLHAVVDRVEQLRNFVAERHGPMPLAEYALRFSLSHDAVHTVIPGMRNRNQVEQNVRAADGGRLSDEEKIALRRFAWRKDFWFEELPMPRPSQVHQEDNPPQK